MSAPGDIKLEVMIGEGGVFGEDALLTKPGELTLELCGPLSVS